MVTFLFSIVQLVSRRGLLLPQGVYLGCTNGVIVCMDPEAAVLLGTTAALEPEPEPAAVISSIAVNKEAVVSASSNSPQLSFYSRCIGSTTSGQQQQQESRGMQLIGSVRASTQGEHRPAC